MNELNWGIVATGNIATEMATDLLNFSQGHMLAVASRSRDNGERFAKKFKISRVYDNYQRLFKDGDIDLVYIATPHNSHFSLAMDALQHNKHVLCEKPLCTNHNDAVTLVNTAKERGLFLQEAVWMRFFPLIHKVKGLLKQQVIGQPLRFSAQFCFKAECNPSSRLFNPELAGGALLDIGMYPLNLATFLFGPAHSATAKADFSPSGVDVTNNIQLQHSDGIESNLTASLCEDRPLVAKIFGTDGSIEIAHKFICPNKLSILKPGKPDYVYSDNFDGLGYGYEIQAVEQAISSGQGCSDFMPLADTLSNLLLMDKIRAEWQ